MWAPEIHYVNNNYIVYFTARQKVTKALCIGAAVSTTGTPLGPYKDLGKPLVTNTTYKGIGVIDVHHFYDIDGTPYLIWKTDGNAVGKESSVLIRKINKDGISFHSSAPITRLIKSTLVWERLIVEGPWMIHRDPYYYLFYSGDGFTSIGYSVGVARSKSLLGPYEKHKGTILHTDFNSYVKGENTSFVGPGHCSVVEVS